MKKAIIEASFGTSRINAFENSVLALKETFEAAFSDYEIFTALTSPKVLSALKKQGLNFDTADEALSRLKENGFTEVIIQPTHFIAGFEYEMLLDTTKKYKNDFQLIKVGAPLLESKDDMGKVCRIIAEKFPNETVVLMGHGTEHSANKAYTSFRRVCIELGFDNIYTTTVEAEPTIDDVIAELKLCGKEKVTLMPLMFVAGDHAENDMAGNSPDSMKSHLEAAGIEVKCVLKGLGEYPEIRSLYCEHINNVLKG